MSVFGWLAVGAAVAFWSPIRWVPGRRTAGLARQGRLARAIVPTRSRLRPPLSASTFGLGCCAACAGTGALLGGVALGIAAAAIAATVAALVSSTLARRRDARRRRGLLTAVRLLVAELEAGSRPGSALAAAAAVVAAADHAAAFAAAASSAAAGGEVADVLLGSGADLEPLAHAWRLGARSGAPMADVLDRVAADLADHEQQQRAVAVALAGPQSSGALLAVLPVVGITLGAAMGVRPLAFLLTAPDGRVLCCIGVLLDAAGVLWTQRLVRRAQRA